MLCVGAAFDGDCPDEGRGEDIGNRLFWTHCSALAYSLDGATHGNTKDALIAALLANGADAGAVDKFGNPVSSGVKFSDDTPECHGSDRVPSRCLRSPFLD